jgi:hypothetical protein
MRCSLPPLVVKFAGSAETNALASRCPFIVVYASDK